MGLIRTQLTIRPSARSTRSLALNFLVDSGAEYSVVPETDLASLGVRPNRSITIVLADGSAKRRQVGDVFFDFRGVRAPAPVIFGEGDDEALLGAVTLQSLGLVLDPLSRRIYRKERIRV